MSYIIYRVPHKKLDVTPYEVWKEILRVWDCLVHAGPEGSKDTEVSTIYQNKGVIFPSINANFFENFSFWMR